MAGFSPGYERYLSLELGKGDGHLAEVPTIDAASNQPDALHRGCEAIHGNDGRRPGPVRIPQEQFQPFQIPEVPVIASVAAVFETDAIPNMGALEYGQDFRPDRIGLHSVFGFQTFNKFSRISYDLGLLQSGLEDDRGSGKLHPQLLQKSSFGHFPRFQLGFQ